MIEIERVYVTSRLDLLLFDFRVRISRSIYCTILGARFDHSIAVIQANVRMRVNLLNRIGR